MTFFELGLSDDLSRHVLRKGYVEPTAIQNQAIPLILKHLDLMACAQTGTGKTAAFVLPILDLLNRTKKDGSMLPRALILAPTRELAVQIQDFVEQYSAPFELRSTVTYGGVKVNRQMKRLGRGVDILVSTTGRLIDLVSRGAAKLQEIELVVLDEADRMLELGFIQDVKKIFSLLPKQRQNLLFSATFSPDIRQLGQSLLKNHIEVNVEPKQTVSTMIEHKLFSVDRLRKAELLSYLIRENNWQQVLIFCRTRLGADRLVRRLVKEKILARAIHGHKSQIERAQSLSDFKEGQLNVLVATDIAARGLDILQLPYVINFDLPDVAEDYVHRIGRTGRAGIPGQAVSLVCADDIRALAAIEQILGQCISRDSVKGFEPEAPLPTVLPKVDHILKIRPKRHRRFQNSKHSQKKFYKQSGRSDARDKGQIT